MAVWHDKKYLGSLYPWFLLNIKIMSPEAEVYTDEDERACYYKHALLRLAKHIQQYTEIRAYLSSQHKPIIKFEKFRDEQSSITSKEHSNSGQWHEDSSDDDQLAAVVVVRIIDHCHIPLESVTRYPKHQQRKNGLPKEKSMQNVRDGLAWVYQYAYQ